jgi:cell division protein ZapD
VIIYEYPFEERIRTYLRLEHLCDRLSTQMARDSALDHHFALATLFEIMDVGARADLKSDLLKDLEKNKQTLNGYRGNPAISEKALDGFVAQLDQAFAALNSVPGKVGQGLTENDWLMSIRSRIGIPGGTCAFDLPSYYAWQQEPGDARRNDLIVWTACVAPMAQAVQLLLRMLRDSGVSQRVMASGGQYQQHLVKGRSYQLLRLSIDPALGLIPEISGNRLIVSIRLMRRDAEFKLQHAPVEAAFDLTLCT